MLRARGDETLIASWEAYADGAADACVRRLPGVVVAVFPEGPERGVYNNAILEPGADARAVDAMEAAYAGAGVTAYAAWVRPDDTAMRIELEARGYVVDTTTRAMGMRLADARGAAPVVDAEPVDWAEYLRVSELPPDLLRDADHARFHVVVARLDGRPVAAGLAFDRDGDCGIYNIGTQEPFRRCGLATALTVRMLEDAAARGCETASLQSTAVAERVYAGVGFRDLGGIVEYVPA